MPFYMISQHIQIHVYCADVTINTYIQVKLQLIVELLLYENRHNKIILYTYLDFGVEVCLNNGSRRIINWVGHIGPSCNAINCLLWAINIVTDQDLVYIIIMTNKTCMPYNKIPS